MNSLIEMGACRKLLTAVVNEALSRGDLFIWNKREHFCLGFEGVRSTLDQAPEVRFDFSHANAKLHAVVFDDGAIGLRLIALVSHPETGSRCAAVGRIMARSENDYPRILTLQCDEFVSRAGMPPWLMAMEEVLPCGYEVEVQ